MATIETIRKDVLCVTLGAHEAPASYRWEATSFLVNEEDGSDARPPLRISCPVSREDVVQHLGEAWAKVQDDIKADQARYSALQAEFNAFVERAGQLIGEFRAEAEQAKADRDAAIAAKSAQ